MALVKKSANTEIDHEKILTLTSATIVFMDDYESEDLRISSLEFLIEYLTMSEILKLLFKVVGSDNKIKIIFILIWFFQILQIMKKMMKILRLC